MGIQNSLKILGSADCVVRVIMNPFWKFLRLRNSAWDFFFLEEGGLTFGPGIFFWVWLEALGIFWVLIFAPILSSPSLEIPNTPPPLGYVLLLISSVNNPAQGIVLCVLFSRVSEIDCKYVDCFAVVCHLSGCCWQQSWLVTTKFFLCYC